MSGILTEEELKEWYEDTRELLPAVSEYRIKRLIGSNRSYLSANAELSFKNAKIPALENDNKLLESCVADLEKKVAKYESALNDIVNGHWTSYMDDDKLRVWQTDRINPKKIALEALEELK